MQFFHKQLIKLVPTLLSLEDNCYLVFFFFDRAICGGGVKTKYLHYLDKTYCLSIRTPMD